MSSDGTLVVAVRADASVRLIDAVTGTTRRPLEAPMATDYPDAGDTAFSPDNRFLSQSGAHPALWDLETGARVPL